MDICDMSSDMCYTDDMCCKYKDCCGMDMCDMSSDMCYTDVMYCEYKDCCDMDMCDMSSDMCYTEDICCEYKDCCAMDMCDMSSDMCYTDEMCCEYMDCCDMDMCDMSSDMCYIDDMCCEQERLNTFHREVRNRTETLVQCMKTFPGESMEMTYLDEMSTMISDAFEAADAAKSGYNNIFQVWMTLGLEEELKSYSRVLIVLVV